MLNPAEIKAQFSSRSQEWETPPELFRAVDEEFHFTLDVCATVHNAKCQGFFSMEEDGLAQQWQGVCWMNPPYGREIALWVKKAREEAAAGRATVVCLLPVRTDTRWWQQEVIGGRAQVRFLAKRVRFVGAPQPAPFPSAVVIFRRKDY